MKTKLIAPIVLAGTILLAGNAFAATQSKSGEIKTLDATKHELVLTTGDTFELGKTVKADKLKAGEKVTITYDMKDGKMIASKIHAAK